MWLEILILVLAIPVGLLISYMTKEELISGRKWFKFILVVCVVLGIWFYFKELNYLVLTFAFIFIITLISLIKSYSK